VIPGRAGRAVTGISMGGFGALKSALRRPDLWAHASSLSGALIPLDPESVAGYGWLQRRILRRVFGPLDGANVYARDDVRTLARRPAPPDAPPLLLRSGREDEYRLGEAAERMATLLERSGWTVTLVLEPGAHDWDYWRTSAVETIAWHARQFPPPHPASE
jgi:S-formylglutathione hydrolase FrmB